MLKGGRDYFSNGIHLNVIEAADDPAGESWLNLHAIDDLVREIVETETHLTIAALGGDAAAGGVTLALAADHVVAREDVVLNPYYGHMGGLYGSEYWTYLLPRRVGAEMAAELTSSPFEALGTRRAVEIGLLDDTFGDTVERFHAGVREDRARAPAAGASRACSTRSVARARQRRADQAAQRVPVAQELVRSHDCFFGEGSQLPRSATPVRPTSSAPRAP